MNWRDVDMKLIVLNESKVEKQYRSFYSQGNINLALDTVPARKKRDYRKELTQGYIRLLSNQQLHT